MGIVEFDTNILPTPHIPLLTIIHTQLFAVVELMMITMWYAYVGYRLVYILVGYRPRRILQSILRDVSENPQSKADVERFVRITMDYGTCDDALDGYRYVMYSGSVRCTVISTVRIRDKTYNDRTTVHEAIA